MIDSPRVLAIINAIDKRYNRKFGDPHPENWGMLPVTIYHEWIDSGAIENRLGIDVSKSRADRDKLVEEGRAL